MSYYRRTEGSGRCVCPERRSKVLDPDGKRAIRCEDHEHGPRGPVCRPHLHNPRVMSWAEAIAAARDTASSPSPRWPELLAERDDLLAVLELGE